MDSPEVKKEEIQKKLSRHPFSKRQKNLLEKYLLKPIAYVSNDNFQRSGKIKSILEKKIQVLSGELLTAENEYLLFQQMNYARYRMAQIRKGILSKTRWPKSRLQELLHWHQFQQETCGKIVTANMGLVLAMAKRCIFPKTEFADLVSEGSMALLRATEKFDFDRGFKFSTYACRVIYRSFYRIIKDYYRYHSKFPVQWDPAMEKSDYLEKTREENRLDRVDQVRAIVNKNLADLSGVEQSVIKMRFSFKDQKSAPLTLKQVGSRLGLSKERIRQIQNKALSKLRVVANDRMVMS